MKSGPAHLYIFIIPPEAYTKRPRVYWKLLALAYDVCDARRQWLKTSDLWMMRDLGMKWQVGAHQVFTKRDDGGILTLIVSKTTDDFLAAGSRKSVIDFFEKMRERFTVGKAIVEDNMNYNVCVIDIGQDKVITLGMYEYLDILSPI